MRLRGAAVGLIVVLLGAAGCPRERSVPVPAPTFAAAERVNDVDDGWAQAEPSMIVAGDRVLVAWMDFSTPEPSLRVSVSVDDGSFQSSTVIGAGNAHRGYADPTLARTTDGRVYLAYLECRQHSLAPNQKACQIWMRSTADAGDTWSDPVPIGDGPTLREDRPWLATHGSTLFASWSEESKAAPPSWVLAERNAEGAFVERARVEGRKSYTPVAVTSDAIEALLVDYHSPADRLYISHARAVRAAESMDFEMRTRFEIPTNAVLVDLAVDALAADREGHVYAGFLVGGSEESSLRGAVGSGGPGKPRPRFLRAGSSGRVTLPWVAGRERGFVAAWLEETPDGWVVAARCLDATGTPSAAARLSSPGPFEPGNRKSFVGDFLDIRVEGPDVYVVWSDASDGDADIYLATGRCSA